MASTHHKLRRKDLKQPDDFISFLESSQEFFTNHLTEVIAAASAIVVIAAIVAGIRLYQAHRSRMAADEFYQAFTALDGKQYKLAEQRFTRLAADMPGQHVGRLARFYLATCYLEQNNLPQARDALLSYIANGHGQMFKSLAMMDLGVVYEHLGDLKQAEQTYLRAAAIPGPEQTRAELGAARILAHQGKSRRAIDAYQSFLNNHPYAPERQEAMEALAQLGASPAASPIVRQRFNPVPASSAHH
ncbi:MAG: tetratricopeptide repeat protein [Candidatus Binataceae bacterium]